MKSIRRATTADSRKIDNLRITEFKQSTEFSLLKPEKLMWNQCDEDHVVLAAWDRDEPVSTMRAVVVNDHNEAARTIQCSVPTDIAFPAIVFNSAATSRPYRGIGLNQALRYYYLLAAIRGKIETILSPIYQGAPRIQFMLSLGYTFIKPECSWQDKLSPKSDRILGVLTKKSMRRALLHIHKTRGRVLWEYIWQGAPIHYNQPTGNRKPEKST